MTEANSLNASTVGVMTNTGTSFIGTTTTAYAPICGSVTAGGAVQAADTNISNVGYVLKSTGASSLPTWQPDAGSATFDGDTGSATGSTITFDANTNCGSTVLFSATGSTVSLNVTNVGLENTIIGQGSGNGSISGADNICLGHQNYVSLTSGNTNIAIGNTTLFSATTTTFNTAIGNNALGSLTADTTGHIGIGRNALSVYDGSSPAGGGNVAIGNLSLSALTTTGGNVTVGHINAPTLTTGENNVIVGSICASNWASNESNNIIIGSHNPGTASESNTLRVGVSTGTGTGQLNKVVICGINGITVTGTAVLVSSSDQLGIAVSSRRFKENIQEMGDVSSDIYNLRPVKYNPKGDPFTFCTGLIAEEVEQVMPHLVHYEKDGSPLSVKYHELPALLLNEIQKLKDQLDDYKYLTDQLVLEIKKLKG